MPKSDCVEDDVNQLRELEGREEVKGFGLQALSTEDLALVTKTIQDNIPPKPTINVWWPAGEDSNKIICKLFQFFIFTMYDL